VLFTDLVGSTQLAAELGDQRWRKVHASHHAFIRRTLHEFDGHEISTAGDSFLATFKSPAQAVLCAITISRGLAKIGLKVRAGVHTGELELMRRELRGIAVHIGARVAAAAQAGEVLVSSTVKDMVTGSEIQFQDRGVRTLRGVPGEWRLYAADSTQVMPVGVGTPTPTARRLPGNIAIPFIAAPATLLVVAVAVLLFALTRGGSVGASVVPGPNAAGRFDAAAGRFVAAAHVGNRPAGIAVGGGSTWVINQSDGTLSRIDSSSSNVIRTKAVGGTPTGVAYGDNSVWITAQLGLSGGGEEGSVIRYDPGTDTITQVIPVGNGVGGIAYGAGSIWVTNKNRNTVVQIDPATNSISNQIPVGQGPEAVAVAADGSVWVANTLDRTVSRIGPGATVAKSVQVPEPTAIAIGAGSVWVISAAASSVTRIDLLTNTTVRTIQVDAGPSAIAFGAGAVWVTSSTAGRLERIDPATNRITSVLVNGRPSGLAVDGGSVWIAVQGA
jgi:YVTN family beta-propeller protein